MPQAQWIFDCFGAQYQISSRPVLGFFRPLFGFDGIVALGGNDHDGIPSGSDSQIPALYDVAGITTPTLGASPISTCSFALEILRSSVSGSRSKRGSGR